MKTAAWIIGVLLYSAVANYIINNVSPVIILLGIIACLLGGILVAVSNK